MSYVDCYFIGGPWDLTKRALDDPPREFQVTEPIPDSQMSHYERDKKGELNAWVLARFFKHTYIGNYRSIGLGGKLIYVYFYAGAN